MRLLHIAAIALFVAACIVVSAPTAQAEQFDIISRTQIAPNTVQVRIDKPNPTVPAVEYPSITFNPGDVVTINAGGCVQSGGLGNTWHRYVNPTGPDTDKLYHGLITIPYATGVLDPIQEYNGKTVTVAYNAPRGTHLQLGFQDGRGDYSDNGYYSHDDGPNDQCKGSDGGPAWITLTIVSGGTPAPSAGGGPFDLVFGQFDSNGVPLNPDWRKNVDSGGADPGGCTWPWSGSPQRDGSCTSQITNIDTHYTCDWFSAIYGLGGHANWIAGTYHGIATFAGKSAPVYDDDDYSFDVATDGFAGRLTGSPTGVHLEFNSEETIDTLSDFGLPWWRAVHDTDDTGRHGLIDGHQVLFTGLVGIDFAHTPGTESHPAWGFAIESNPAVDDDTWSIFARNWGDEGYCSGDQHYIDYLGNQYAMSIPWPAGAVSGTLKPATQFYSDADTAPGVDVAFIPHQEVRVTFTGLPDPSDQKIIGGELHIAWVMSSHALRRLPRPPIAIVGRRPVAAGTTTKDRIETFLEQAVARLTPAQRAVYHSALPHVARRPHSKRRLATHSHVSQPRLLRRIVARPRIRAVPDPKRVALQEARLNALRKAYGGSIPGFPLRRRMPL